EVRALHALLDGGARLVTIHGAAGLGKTRIARQVATERPVASLFCDVSRGRSADELLVAVARALAVPLPRDGALLDAVGRALMHRGDLLLVLDNLEQLDDDAPLVIGRLLLHAPA